MKSQPKFRYLNKKEEEQAIIQILEVLLDKSVPFSGPHRKKQWEKGWGENLESGDTTPKYFGKHKVNRLNGRLVYALDPHYEQKMLYQIVDHLAEKYLKDLPHIWEFGCGTGHNLWRVKAINKTARFIGFDWVDSAVKMIDAQGFQGGKFDFFNPPKIKQVDHSSDIGVFTVAALEQTGTNYKKFVNYLLKLKPNVVVHVEPMPELLDSTKLLDYLSIQYMHKRNYLRGYPDYLEKLEKQGKLKIIEKRRSGIGSMFIDGYSILVWKPL